MVQHLKGLAGTCMHLADGVADPFFLEIGCNDGSLSTHFARRGHRHIGIDPARHATEEAKNRRVSVIVDRFGPQAARAIRERHGQAHVVVAANVMAHILQLRQTFGLVRDCLARDGIFVFEAISLLDLLQSRAFDLFYDEHVFTFSARAVDRLARAVGLELFDCETLPIQGWVATLLPMLSGKATSKHAGRGHPDARTRRWPSWSESMGRLRLRRCDHGTSASCHFGTP